MLLGNSFQRFGVTTEIALSPMREEVERRGDGFSISFKLFPYFT